MLSGGIFYFNGVCFSSGRIII